MEICACAYSAQGPPPPTPALPHAAARTEALREVSHLRQPRTNEVYSGADHLYLLKGKKKGKWKKKVGRLSGVVVESWSGGGGGWGVAV